MPVTPTGPVSVALSELATLIANVPFFQTWVGAGSEAAALNSVYIGEAGWKIAAITIAGGVLTIQTTEPHNMLVGQTVEIDGASTGAQAIADIDGPVTLTAVTADTISATTELPDLATCYPDQAVIVPARPFAVLRESENPLNVKSIGTGGAISIKGSIDILVEADTSPGYANDPVNAPMEASDSFSNFLNGLGTTQETGDLMFLHPIDTKQPPTFVQRHEQDDNTKRFERWFAIIRAGWGVD